jgi:hypothetical protein
MLTGNQNPPLHSPRSEGTVDSNQFHSTALQILVYSCHTTHEKISMPACYQQIGEISHTFQTLVMHPRVHLINIPTSSAGACFTTTRSLLTPFPLLALQGGTLCGSFASIGGCRTQNMISSEIHAINFHTVW